MESYDIIMLAVVGLATFFGFIKGFAWQLASLASLVLSYICALRFADQLAPHLNADPRWNKYLAMLVIYVGTSFAVWMAFRYVSGAIDRVKLREFDRQMGGLVGLGKGVLLCTVITFFAVTLSEQSRGAVLRSKSGVYIAEFLHKAKPIMPPELSQLLKPHIERIEQGLDPMQPGPAPLTIPQIPSAPGAPGGGLMPPLQDQFNNPEFLERLRQTEGQLRQLMPQTIPGQPIGPSGFGPAPGQGSQVGFPGPATAGNPQSPPGFMPR